MGVVTHDWVHDIKAQSKAALRCCRCDALLTYEELAALKRPGGSAEHDGTIVPPLKHYCWWAGGDIGGKDVP